MGDNKNKKKDHKNKKSKKRQESDQSSSDNNSDNGSNSGSSGSDVSSRKHRMTKTHKSLMVDKIHLLNIKNALWSNKWNKPIEKQKAWKDLLAYAKSLKILRPFKKGPIGIKELQRWFVQWKNRCNRRIQVSERTGMGHVRPLSDLDRRFYDLRMSVAGQSQGKQVGLRIPLESCSAIPLYSQTQVEICLIKFIKTRICKLDISNI